MVCRLGKKKKVFNNFYKIFKESNVDKSHLNGVVFCTLSNEDNIILSSPFIIHQLDGVAG